jgi:hypothetical protein
MEEKVIPILRVQDAEIAVAWYQRLGFQQTSVHRFEPGFPAFVTIERASMKLFLSEHKGDARPDTLIYLQVADVHPIAKEFAVRVEEAPWGIRNRTPRSRHKPAAHRNAKAAALQRMTRYRRALPKLRTWGPCCVL